MRVYRRSRARITGIITAMAIITAGIITTMAIITVMGMITGTISHRRTDMVTPRDRVTMYRRR